MTYKQDLIEQIVLDYLAIRERSEPGEWFYRCRIADYKETLMEMSMSIEEDKFKKLFIPHYELVKDMDTLQLRAHREELMDIIYNAKVYVQAVDKVDEDRKKAKYKSTGPNGIERNLNTDETTTNAIKTIKERQGRMSKVDRAAEALLKVPGMDPSFVESLMKNKNILDATKRRAAGTVEPMPQAPRKIAHNPFNKNCDCPSCVEKRAS
jgi:hypothetical protein